jgi:hypothetical protein
MTESISEGAAMKIAILAMMVGMMSLGARGQQTVPPKCPDGIICTDRRICMCKPANEIKEPAPLKCGKYEFVDSPPPMCGDVMNGCYAPHCAPLMHMLTEKEWQTLNDQLRESREHIRALESRLCVNPAGMLWDCKVKPPKEKL